MFLFDWATMPVQNFVPKLAAAWLGFYLLLGLPVSAFTFDVHKELVQCLAAASAGSSFVVTVLVWRLYLVSPGGSGWCGEFKDLRLCSPLDGWRRHQHQQQQQASAVRCLSCAHLLLMGLDVAGLSRGFEQSAVTRPHRAGRYESNICLCLCLCFCLQGWQHVGDRLISATVEYEETGWYDGQVRGGWTDPCAPAGQRK
jgi:uncharacterized membrane protein